MQKLMLLLLFPILVFSQAIGLRELVNVKDIIPDMVIDIRYNTTKNFTGEKLYSTDECFYSMSGIKTLEQIQDSLHNVHHFNGYEYPKGLGLKIFDAYRPHTIQYVMWDLVGAPFVANPANGSRHNRGSAIDLTIIDMASLKELDMGTDFDFFGDEASHNYKGFSNEILNNRSFLRSIMLHYNFTDYSVEWWHYEYIPAMQYPLLDFELK